MQVWNCVVGLIVGAGVEFSAANVESAGRSGVDAGESAASDDNLAIARPAAQTEALRAKALKLAAPRYAALPVASVSRPAASLRR